jgi:hypothetical protein
MSFTAPGEMGSNATPLLDAKQKAAQNGQPLINTVIPDQDKEADNAFA